MITKGIIKTLDFNGNTCTVHLPLFETPGNDPIIGTATISNTPGSYNGYKVGDVVWVAFEDGSMSSPVVIGKLYLGAEAERADPRGVLNVENSTVSKSATMPSDTKLSAELDGNVPNTTIPFSSLSSIANNLNTLNTTVAQNDRDYGNRFKQTITYIDAEGAKLSTNIEQTNEYIKTEAEKLQKNIDGSETKLTSYIDQEAGKITQTVTEEVKRLDGRVDTTNSTLESTADSINARVTTKLDFKNEGWEYDEAGNPIKTDKDGKELNQRSLGWDLTNNSWVIKAYDQNNDNTLPKEGLDIFKIKRDSVEINTPQVRLSGYPRKTIIRYAYGTKDTYPKLYSSQDANGNDIKSVNDTFINGYDVDTKTNSIWTTTELPWHEEKYVWQWTQSAQYKYVEKNSDKEDSGYWEDTIEDTVIRQSGDSAVSYWTNCQTLVHTGENHGSNIVVTAMRKVGTKNEEEDKLTKVIHANTGEEIVEYGGAFLWWRYKTISNEWTLAAAKYKINFTFPSEVPNDDIEIIATHDDTFNPNAEGVNISKDAPIYDKETIVYSPLNTPVISLSNDSAQINYLSDGVTKAPEATDYVESEANLYLSGNKLTSNNISYNWEVIPANGCIFEGNTNTALIKVKDIITESVVVKCTISINENGIDGKFKNTSYQKDFTITKAVQGDKGDVGESTYIIDIDNDFATIPMTVTNKQIYRKNKFKPTEADHGYSGKYTLANLQDNMSPLSMRALPKANTVPGLPLNVLNDRTNAKYTLLKEQVTGLPEETKVEPEETTESSYIQSLSTHKVRVYYGTELKEIKEDNFIVKLDHDEITEIAEGNYLICEIGSYKTDGSLSNDDLPGMNPSVTNDTVTNYITTMSGADTKASNIYIKYTYYVDGVDVATAKVELVRNESPTTYYMLPSIKSIKVKADETPEVTSFIVTPYIMSASDGESKETTAYIRYRWKEVSKDQDWKNYSSKIDIPLENDKIDSDIISCEIELYTNNTMKQLWDREVINVIRDGNGIASQTTYYALIHHDYTTGTIKAPTEDNKIVYSGTTDLIKSEKALSNWSTEAPKHKLEKTDDPNTLGWKYWTSIRTEKADGTIEYSTPIISEDLNGVYALMQGKTTNYYSSEDPAKTHNVKEGDCWFDTGYKLVPSSELTTKGAYLGRYIGSGTIKTKVTSNNIDSLSISPGTTAAYTSGELKQWDGNKWTDIGSELVANKVTANFINAMDITAKKIEILDSSNPQQTIFKADGTSSDKTNAVIVGGFNVGSSTLSGISYSNEGSGGTFADKIRLKESVNLQPAGLSLYTIEQKGTSVASGYSWVDDTKKEVLIEPAGIFLGTANDVGNYPIELTSGGTLSASSGNIGICSFGANGLTTDQVLISSNGIKINNAWDESLELYAHSTTSYVSTNNESLRIRPKTSYSGFTCKGPDGNTSSSIKITATIVKTGLGAWKISAAIPSSIENDINTVFYIKYKSSVWADWSYNNVYLTITGGSTTSNELNFSDWSWWDDATICNTRSGNYSSSAEKTITLHSGSSTIGRNYSHGNFMPFRNDLDFGSKDEPWNRLYVKEIYAGKILYDTTCIKSETAQIGDGKNNSEGGGSSSVDTGLAVTCFDAGTKVVMADYTVKNIEDIVTGEEVLSYNTKNETFISSKVKSTLKFNTWQDLVLLIFKDGTKLWTTMSHPFYTTSGWVSLMPNYSYHDHEDLFDQYFEMMTPGQKFYKFNPAANTIEHIELISIKYRHGVSTDHYVYNLDVDNCNTFFTEGILGHNVKGNFNHITKA